MRLEHSFVDTKDMIRNILVEQMMEFLGYAKVPEKYVDGIYVYDDWKTEIEYK